MRLKLAPRASQQNDCICQVIFSMCEDFCVSTANEIPTKSQTVKKHHHTMVEIMNFPNRNLNPASTMEAFSFPLQQVGGVGAFNFSLHNIDQLAARRSPLTKKKDNCRSAEFTKCSPENHTHGIFPPNSPSPKNLNIMENEEDPKGSGTPHQALHVLVFTTCAEDLLITSVDTQKPEGKPSNVKTESTEPHHHLIAIIVVIIIPKQ